MDSCRRSTARSLLSLVLPLFLSIVIPSAVFLGCSGERSVRPLGQSPPENHPAIEVWVQGTPIARFDRPRAVEALLAALPERERALIGIQGHCVTRDPALRRVLHELLIADSAPGKGGFAGHIRDATWGEIKIVMAGRRR